MTNIALWTLVVSIAQLLVFVSGGLKLYLLLHAKLDKIEWLAKEFTPHRHMERGGGVPLTTDGISAAKTTNGR